MVVPHAILPDLNTLDADSLRAPLVETHERYCTTAQRLQSRESEIEHLKLLLAKLQRMQFGRKSEKLQRQIEQLELRLEDLEEAQEEDKEPAKASGWAQTAKATAAQKEPARRRPLPSHLPRVTRTHAPKEQSCPGCGGKRRPLGGEVSERWGYMAAHFHVIRQGRS